jgi:pimeloyl-ACP methyl ester carboxylesterase
MKRRILTLIFLPLALSLVLSAPSALAQALSGYGVVLMHGKQGRPDGPIAGVASALRAAGAQVVTPEMPWSRLRMYDASYKNAMAQIDSAEKKLRAKGKTKIVIAGMSFGANAAIGYAARHGDIASGAALSPGHTPEMVGFQKLIGGSVDKAKKLSAAGKGSTRDQFSALIKAGHSVSVRHLLSTSAISTPAVPFRWPRTRAP